MGMKYKDPSTGQLKELSLKAADTLPIGTIVDYDGEEVPDGWEEVEEEKDVYSTEEVKTNKVWIDGKPIYRKVIETTSPSSSDTNTNIYTITENMEDIIDLKGQLNAERPSYKGSINCYITNGDYIATWAMTSNYNPTNIRCRCSSNRTSSPMRIIMEYTKTTD